SVTETRQLGQRAAVVGESLELDELDAVDGRRGPVGLEVKGALGVGREFHRPDLDLTAPPRPGATGTARRNCPSSASRSTRRRPPCCTPCGTRSPRCRRPCAPGGPR